MRIENETPTIDATSDYPEELRDIGAERVYVAAILSNNELIEEIDDDDLEILTDSGYRNVVRYVKELYHDGFPEIDKATIVNLAGKNSRIKQVLMDMGGIDYLEMICSYQMSLVNFPRTRQLLLDLYAQRKVLAGAEQQVKMLKEMVRQGGVTADDLTKAMDTTTSEVTASVYVKSDIIVVAPDADEFIAKIERDRAAGRNTKGPISNQPGMDEHLGCFGNGRHYCIGAPTGCGKSMVNVNLARSMSLGLVAGDPTYKVAVIDTGELIYEEDYLPRLLACESGVSLHAITHGYFVDNPADKDAVYRAMKRLEKNPILWLSMPDFDGPTLYAAVKKFRKRYGIDIFMFDNIKPNPRWGTDTRKGGDIYNKIGDLSQYIKDAAVAQEIPGISFIQLGADGTKTGRKKIGEKRPHISMYAGGQRTLHNVDVAAVMDWEIVDDEEGDVLNENRILMWQKFRNGRPHRSGEYILMSGDLKRSRLVAIDNIVKGQIDHNPHQPLVSTHMDGDEDSYDGYDMSELDSYEPQVEVPEQLIEVPRRIPRFLKK